MDRCKVIKIDEPDYGCEGLPEGAVRKDMVTLFSADAGERILWVPDDYLYDNDINEGDTVCIEGRHIVKEV